MPDIKMTVSALTDVGRARTHNEDAFAVLDLASGIQLDTVGADRAIDLEDRGVLLALSDGMGGAQAGEVASALVLASLRETLTMGGKGPMHEQLEEAVERANREVLDAAMTSNRTGMGATLTAIIVRGAQAFIAEVGDSRAYLLRNGRLRQITRDQSLAQLLVDQGVMSAQEARQAPGKNVILQAVGLAEGIRVAIAKLELRREDRFLLCSDGVTNKVTDDELREIMTGSDPRSACETMIALANDRGGEDNETAIVADITGADLVTTEEFETVTETYSVLKSYDAMVKGQPVSADVAQAAGRAVGMAPAPAPAPKAAPAPQAAPAPKAPPAPKAQDPEPAAPPRRSKPPSLLPEKPAAPVAPVAPSRSPLPFVVGGVVLVIVVVALVLSLR